MIYSTRGELFWDNQQEKLQDKWREEREKKLKLKKKKTSVKKKKD